MPGKDHSGTGGCLVLVAGVLLVGSCMMGGSDDSAAQLEQELVAVADAAAQTPPHSSNQDAPPPAAPARIGSTLLEQAILDAFPSNPPSSRSEKKTASDAADLVGLAINTQGHLCARAVEAQPAAAGMYGVGCITHQTGHGFATYLVNAHSGAVTPI